MNKVKVDVQFSLRYTDEAIDLFASMERIREENGLKRLNSVILLEALLEERESFLYGYLCETSLSEVPYRKIVRDCDTFYKYLKNNERPIGKNEKSINVKTEDNKVIKLIIDDDMDYIIDTTINEAVQSKLRSELTSFLSSYDPESGTNDEEDFESIYEDYQDYEDDFDIEANNLEYNVSEEDEDEEDGEDDNVKKAILSVEATIDSENFLFTLFNLRPAPVLEILKRNGVDIDSIELYAIDDESESAEVETNTDGIPKSLSDFVTSLSSKYEDAEECEIMGRDKEEQQVMQILQKRGRKNAILVGEAGVGKSAIAEKIAYDIAKGNCPESLKDNIVLELNINNSIAGTIYRGMAEERFQNLVKFLESHQNIILFIDEIHTIIGAGSTGNDSDDMANALKPFLASKNAKIIGATTSLEYEKILSSDPAFKRRFKKVEVKEPRSKEVYPMLLNQIKAHEEYHGVTISKEMVDYAILISSAFNHETANPDRTNDLIDTAMVIAKDRGKTEVDRECILANFDINFKKYANMSMTYKLATAYHEAGHYLVWRLGNVCNNMQAIAISVMPAEDYLGVTVFDDVSDEFMVHYDEDYLLNSIAIKLGGRIAEKMYTNKISQGADNDLEQANKLAYDMICKYGMSEDSLNSVFLNNDEYHMMSEKVIDKIDFEIKKIISKATDIATDLLKKNSDLLDRLAKQLATQGIMDEHDIEEFFNNV